jgi:radical SAM peptide maturase (CXXX-repeat target family)
MRKFEQYQDMIARVYPELCDHDDSDTQTLSREVTFQVTDKCNLACTYCYQINKGVRRMKFEYAKELIDLLLSQDPKLNGYVTTKNSPAIVLDFIGGEPFLEIELIEKICDYFVDKAIEMHHPWATMYMISICSNGVLYFDEKVQQFLNKYRSKVSLSITIDGNKALHDSCRVFPDGSPSYDLAVAAANDWMSRGYYMGSKITIAPGNLDYVYDAIIHMVELGYNDINANCVYEKGWTLEHATKFYHELKRIADYWIDNNLVETHYLALFAEDYFHPKDEDDLQNWCGGTGLMLAMDPDGYLYPCIRYMESSLGNERPPIRIGHVYEGIAQTECTKNCTDCLNKIDRRTQSTDECFYCPIAEGCSWCSGYNYQVHGTPDKRATYICCMHKARSLANVYFWNKWYQKEDSNKVFEMHCPKEWALEIIPEEEYDMLLGLSTREEK